MRIVQLPLWERSHIPGKHSHVVLSASLREWFGIYPQVKQAPHLRLCLILPVIAKVMGLGRLLNGKGRNLPVSSANTFTSKEFMYERVSQMKACFICN